MGSNISIAWRRVGDRSIEWTCTGWDFDQPDAVKTYHCNRYATFFGASGVCDARQVGGGASSVWSPINSEVSRLLRREFRGASVVKEG